MPSTHRAASRPDNVFIRDSGLQAVLWDMDGTIVDTEPYWIEAEEALAGEYGVEWTHEDALKMVGNALMDSAMIIRETIAAGGGPTLDPRSIIDRLSGSVMRRVRERMPWRPGAYELLEDLTASGVPCGLVTMSEGPLASLVAEALPAGTLRFKVTGDMVSRGKPDPEPYLQGLSRLAEWVPGLAPSRVIAIEDSIPGVASAAASGALTLAVPHFIELPEPDGWVQWDSLEGRTAKDLNELVLFGAGA
ncbi:HAD family hydrolase [Zhihengliuella flava]|uniref:HAD superfamily hydrolase (TIGR01509 family) n=1 Tax=Zhihengliuella flava TaxID=1285193 RepID=A0A931GED6_9MICC|nr:HAD family phosphatase [Zhihengliuella flava]MBG6083402.1 HAD superfamily hydrolase (TIGR01509 family) [Zhihengliuella flava]